MNENLMDIKQVANYLQMNKMTVYKLAREGKMPAFKVASEWRFRKDLIDKWLMGQIKDSNVLSGSEDGRDSIDKTVLIVDDDESIQDYFERALKQYRVFKASSGEEAVELVKEHVPDLILLDIRMPGLNGIETLKKIKAINKEANVIMLSAYGTLETNMEAARLGAYASIAKPFDLADMKAIVSDALIR